MSDLFLFAGCLFLFVIFLGFICAGSGEKKKSVVMVLLVGFTAWAAVFGLIHLGVLD